MGKPKKVECASSEESSRQDNHPEVTTDTKNPSTTLYKTAVEAVAAPSGARYHVERPEEKDQIKYSAWQTMLLLESFENQKPLSKLQTFLMKVFRNVLNNRLLRIIFLVVLMERSPDMWIQ
ncbi:hypothetical protein LSAT2_019638 [Lamellibrachia satsuma]|nr:hypothetical protein LSAT2_019638 [Lamellibrachia satsuma]